ncbi:MAG: nicotinate-nucleotide pyrophosphorylase (carboxylating) [Hyphomonadaceae bacterium]|nr:MAG: nicotinate-nucleotide pyrophosphorylase (carboxylating) [Hyphomonadaceae bacterium]KAF0186222.1 MAG: nicotinate-nucleotide pyrophosphorylase (carboxylating) [Hyphomonadaceae bacterium]
MSLPQTLIEPIVRIALAEDFGRAGDITTNATIPLGATANWVMRLRQNGVISGFDAAKLALKLIDKSAKLEILLGDGEKAQKGDIIAKVQGSARSLLMAERTMLNFIGRMSGIATLTSQFVAAIAGTNAKITDTRKTTPGLRAFEKQAVKHGGGTNHRFGLDDAILIKDNHIAAAGGIENALKAAKANVGHLVPIEVEVDSIAQLLLALPFYPKCIMLDNFSLENLAIAVKKTREFAGNKIVLEASGGVNLETVRAIAQTGVDVISVGALTHSAPNFDIGLDSE